MTTAAEAAQEFASGPRVLEAAQRLLGRFPLAALCEALANARPEDAEHLLAALERLTEFDEVHQEFLADEVLGFLQVGASAPDLRVRRLVGKLLVCLAQAEAGAGRICSAELLDVCEALLLDPETGPAEAAAGALRHVVRWPAGFQAILGSNTAGGENGGGLAQRLLDRLSSVPDVTRIRLLSLVVELGRASDEVFATLEARGAYKEVLGAFLTDDILLKLNAVELMEALGSFQTGQEFLSRRGVPEQLASELNDPMCDDSVRLCLTRLLGLVILRAPEALGTLLPSKEAPLAQSMAGLLGSRGDPAGRLCALSAWAHASAHAGGLAFFLRWPEFLQDVLASAASPQGEVCKGAIGCWAAVLQDRPPPGAAAAAGPGALAPAPEAELWDIAEKRLLPLVLKALQGKPFPDIRGETWRLLAVLVQSRPCAQRMLTGEEMRELLLDFTSETASGARIAKHEFVVALDRCHSAWLGAFLDEKVEELLAEYARQGPHWVPRNAAAMVGDAAS